MLRGSNAVITGCSRGIGNRAMRLLAANGANVFACLRNRSESFAAEIEGLERRHSVKITPVFFDFSDPPKITAAAKEILQAKVPIDIVVNNAGMTHNALFTMTPMTLFEEIFQVNFFGPCLFTQYLLKNMIRNAGGSVINISSSSALEANSGLSAYAASKSALLTWSRCLARELGPQNIRVNAIAPGVTDTDILRDLDEQTLKEKINRNALKRIGQPEDIAAAVLFLASKHSSYITGQVIRVDGGM